MLEEEKKQEENAVDHTWDVDLVLQDNFSGPVLQPFAYCHGYTSTMQQWQWHTCSLACVTQATM